MAGPLSLGDRVAALRPNAADLPAITSATDNDLGFYRVDAATGDLIAIDADILWDGVDLSSASTDANLLTGKNASLDESLSVAEHLGVGVDKDYGNIYLCLTTNVAPTSTPVLRLAVDIDEATTS